MKLELLAYLDYQKATFDEQLELATKLNLKQVLVRRFGNETITELNEQAFQYMVQTYTKRKIKVVAVDPLIPSYDLYDPKQKEKFEQLLEITVKRAHELKAEYLYYVIPRFNEITNDTDVIMTHIKEQIAIIKKAKIDVLIKPDAGHKANTYRYILNALKDDRVKLNYDPIYFYTNKDSNVTAYRLLRDYIAMFVAADIDQAGNPRLVGLGKLSINEMFKKLFKNKYNGFVVLDSKLPELIQRASLYKWHDTFFSPKKKLEHKIFYDFIQRAEDYSVFDVIHYQLVILNVIFFNKKID